MHPLVTQQHIDDYARDGAVLVRGLFADFVDDFGCRACVAAFTAGAAAQVVDHHPGAVIGHHHCDGAADPSARPGDEHDPAIHSSHAISPPTR